MILWIGFIVCTAVIVYAGIRLARYGDIIAEKTGLGKTWVGVVLLASVTSLPELMTGISSVTYAGVPDIAVGDVLGSCVFNMLILAILDALYRPMPLSTKAQYGNTLSASFGIFLLSIVAIGLVFGSLTFPVGWIGPYSLLFIVIYFIAMRSVFVYEKRLISATVKDMAVELRYENITMKTALLNYSINAVLVIGAAFFLPKIGEGIAESTGLGQTFVGNIFIAISTSLPEVVVSIGALKIDAIDLAIGNLFGSNIFNILILAIDDVFFIKGPIFSFVNQNHIIPALFAIAMTTTAIIGLTSRAEKKLWFLSWNSIVIIVLYIANLLSLYKLK
jgi:cation:H+ antiporter